MEERHRGETHVVRVEQRVPGTASIWRRFEIRLPCDRTATRGVPAVPEVKSITAGSFIVRSTAPIPAPSILPASDPMSVCQSVDLGPVRRPAR